MLLRASRASFCSHSNKLFLVLTWQPGSLDPNEVRAKGPRADAVQTLSLSGPDLEQRLWLRHEDLQSARLGLQSVFELYFPDLQNKEDKRYCSVLS